MDDHTHQFSPEKLIRTSCGKPMSYMRSCKLCGYTEILGSSGTIAKHYYIKYDKNHLQCIYCKHIISNNSNTSNTSIPKFTVVKKSKRIKSYLACLILIPAILFIFLIFLFFNNPFINTNSYNISSTSEILPEYTAQLIIANTSTSTKKEFIEVSSSTLSETILETIIETIIETTIPENHPDTTIDTLEASGNNETASTTYMELIKETCQETIKESVTETILDTIIETLPETQTVFINETESESITQSIDYTNETSEVYTTYATTESKIIYEPRLPENGMVYTAKELISFSKYLDIVVYYDALTVFEIPAGSKTEEDVLSSSDSYYCEILNIDNKIVYSFTRF